jgi:hypothetical protein
MAISHYRNSSVISSLFQNARRVFDNYDVDKNGILEGEELEKFFELVKNHPQAKMDAKKVV